ncbi:hypothetical protein GGR57DRAFT_485280 [Xylariaceae sp. FL1272]|nr:hypothetical protein GGR57DRAFT_485280 [Xylariaceae sp. FL1272]
MGGGISSLSKVCVIGPPAHPDADIDNTFVSLGIEDTSVDYSSNCGNMLATVGPYAIDVGAVSAATVGAQTSKGVENVTVLIHNTNTKNLFTRPFRLLTGPKPLHQGRLLLTASQVRRRSSTSQVPMYRSPCRAVESNF